MCGSFIPRNSVLRKTNAKPVVKPVAIKVSTPVDDLDEVMNALPKFSDKTEDSLVEMTMRNDPVGATRK